MDERKKPGRKPKPHGPRAMVGFPPDLAEMVRAIAARKGIPQIDYLDRIARKRVERDYKATGGD